MNMENEKLPPFVRRIIKRDKYVDGIFFIILGILASLPLHSIEIKNYIGYFAGPFSILLGIFNNQSI